MALILNKAMAYIREGWRIFPCGVNKKPLVQAWPNVASTDPEQIREWWGRWPDASIGAPTGPGMGQSGAWVLDVDVPENPGEADGRETLAALEAKHCPLPPTVEQKTGGGGRQLFFRWPLDREVRNTAGERGKLGAGLDVRGAGGYVILPPSGHPSGGVYAWSGNGAPLADAPEWLLDLVAPLPKPEAARQSAPSTAHAAGTAYGRKALEEEAAKVAGTGQGGRNHALNQAAFVVGQLVAGGELDRDEAESALMAAAGQSGLPDAEARKTVESGVKAGMKEPRQAPGNAPRMPQDASGGLAPIPASSDETASWWLARELFPRVPFPWEVLPPGIAGSLRQLARACATSATPLPAQALCLMAAALGRKLDVLAKASWREPLVFWACDIRESGAGKTAPMWELAQELTRRQAKEHERFKAEQDEWARTGPQDRQGMTPPRNPRGFFSTNLTLEGVHAELDGHKTGGLAVLLSELSALISGQNQYRAKGGTDREGWLCLHDGKPARVSRARGSVFIQGARVQVCGGIQPGIFRQVFGGGGGQYLEDGTVFRCLFTFEPSMHHELTAESWTDEHRETWAMVLGSALDWADGQKEPYLLALASDAQARFFEWRNALNVQCPDLPPNFRGFLPKAYGYALRIAGTIHALDRFSKGQEPGNVLTLEEMERAIQTVHFYLGQAVDALRLLVGEGEAVAPVEVSARTVLLAQVLEGLRGRVDNGRLAVGYVREAYNAAARPEERFSAHAMGALLRACGLTITNGKHNANGKRGVFCIEWDERTDLFLQQSPPSPTSPLSTEWSGLAEEDSASVKSAMSAGQEDKADFAEWLSAVGNPHAHDAGGLGGLSGHPQRQSRVVL